MSSEAPQYTGDRPNRVPTVKSPPQIQASLSPAFSIALLSSYTSNIEALMKAQESQYLEKLIDLMDKEIFSSLPNSRSADLFRSALNQKIAVEKGIWKESKALEKELFSKKREKQRLDHQLSNFPNELEHRRKELKLKMEENANKQIECSLGEMDYLYKNDPVSIVEDAERQIEIIKEDIVRMGILINEEKRKVKGNDNLVQQYFQLKEKLSKH